MFKLTTTKMDEWDILGLHNYEEMCRINCSCNAFTSVESDGTGCKFSFGQIMSNNPINGGKAETFYMRNQTSSSFNKMLHYLAIIPTEK